MAEQGVQFRGADDEHPLELAAALDIVAVQGQEQDILEQLAVGDPALLLAGQVDEGCLMTTAAGAGNQHLKQRRRRLIIGKGKWLKRRLRLGHGRIPQWMPIVPIMNLR
ncbi:MAG: hypothetical protein ACWGKN_14390 [Desulfoprunum sp.]